MDIPVEPAIDAVFRQGRDSNIAQWGFLLWGIYKYFALHRRFRSLDRRITRLEVPYSCMTNFIPAKYFTPGRTYGGATYTPRLIVCHWMDGTLTSTDKVFSQGIRQASAHFGIGADGTIHRYVKVEDTAWGAGDWFTNLQSINIEHEGQPGVAITDACYAASIALQRELCKTFGIDPLAEVSIRTNVGMRLYPTIVGHGTVSRTGTQCPGTLDLNRIRQGVHAAFVGDVDVSPSVQGELTAFHPNIDFWVVVDAPAGSANFRHAPSLGGLVLATYKNGAEIECVASVLGGHVTLSNGAFSSVWYKSKNHGYFISATVARIK